MDHLFSIELLPVLLAVFASIQCARSYSTRLPKRDRLILVLCVLCALLIMFARSSWWSTFILQGLPEGTSTTRKVWLVFDALVMVVFLLISQQKKP